MPNINTIDRPVSLVGTGRSGTTLLTNVFRQHPAFESYGETANLLFPSYYYAEKCLPFCRPKINNDNAAEHATIATRAMLNGVFHDEKEYWFHKPIMIPSVRRNFDSFELFASWYWQTYKNLFPEAYTMTVIRRPESVIASYMRRWGQTIEQASSNYKFTYKLLLDSSACIDHFLSFENLVNDSEGTIRHLFEEIGCEFHEGCLNAFKKAHAPNQTDGKKDTLSDIKSRQNQTDPLSVDDIDQEIVALYEEASARFKINDALVSIAS